MAKSFPYFKQLDAMDCGPTCLRMVSKHYGKNYSLQSLRDKCYIDRRGVSLMGISEAAENIGFRTMSVKVPFDSKDLNNPDLLDAPLPVIAHWNQKHFIVVYKANKKYVWIADPAEGKFKLDRKTFEKSWVSDHEKGILLLLEPSPDFYEGEGEVLNKKGFGYLLKYLRPYRKLIIQLVLGMFLGSIFQLIFPFLTQSIVDVGIQNQNIGFIYLILIAQVMLFFGQTIVSFVQSWILLHVGTRINVSLINDFLTKLMKLPLGFFDVKMVGDLMQRIGDHHRIESFLTTSTLTVIFSFLNLIVFSIVLLVYSIPIFVVFVIASLLYLAWILIFLKKRKEVDYAAFQEMSENQSTIVELIQGMQEIKLQNSEKKRRWKWAAIQAKLFKVKIRALVINQYQDAGATFINQFKNIIISFIAAKAVIEGQMTLGMMMAVQYIVGQLNAPIQQMIGFIRQAQDTKISLERLGEIHEKDDEENANGPKMDFVPETGDLVLENISFRYNALSEDVLKNIDLTIPKGKITAIVGTSGSGKTTLVKLLLRFYKPTKGQVKLGGIHLDNVQSRTWRNECGAVMQDGFIFSDSIANNIAESDEQVNKDKLLKSVKTANIQEFIETLPLGYNTVIGAKGNGLSQGQKQRLLIARAAYKDPQYIFLDEATNSLDANNEKVIMENMNEFFKGRTVVVVAHRLSTVKNADQIIVLDKGEITEIGKHHDLVEQKGAYFTLVKNQLELGN